MKMDYFDVTARIRKLYGRAVEPVCTRWDLTRNELDVLLFLYNNPQFDRPADIVAYRGMVKSHVSLSVANLERRGLLLRSADSEDRRTVHLRLTEPALEIAETGRKTQEAFYRKVFDGFSRRDYELMHTMLEKVGGNLAQLEK